MYVQKWKKRAYSEGCYVRTRMYMRACMYVCIVCIHIHVHIHTYNLFQEKEGILWRPLCQNVYGLFAGMILLRDEWAYTDILEMLLPFILVFVSFGAQGVLIWYLWISSDETIFQLEGDICKTDSILKVCACVHVYTCIHFVYV